MPSWLTLDGPDLKFKVSLDRRSLDYIRANKPGVAILPMLQNVTAGKWDGAGLAKLMADPSRRTSLFGKIVDFLAANKLQGVTIDFEEVPPAAHRNLETFLSEMSAAFAPHNWIIVQAVPFDDDDWPYQTYADIVDYTMLMAYDEHDDASDPPAPSPARTGTSEARQAHGGAVAGSTIVALGNYGYDWVNGGAGRRQ